jgi:hypothetical protein
MRDRGRLAVPLLAVLTLAAAPALEARDSSLQCTVLPVTSPQQRPLLVSPPFSATRILDVVFHVLTPRQLRGDHALDIKVYTPKGHLYQTLSTRFPAVAASASVTRAFSLATLIRPERVHTVRYAGLKRQLVSARLPVAGTHIVSHSLYGSWRIAPHLDGSLAPCGEGRSFSIEQ